MQAEYHQMKLNLPIEMKEWLWRTASQNTRSATAEIVHILKEKMSETEKAAER